MDRSLIATALALVFAVLAQVIIAPNIAVSAAVPNFILAFILVLSVTRPGMPSTFVLAFVLGFLYDLMGHGPVGITAFLLVLAVFAVSRVFMVLDNDTFFMPVTIIALAAVLLEVLYAAFMIVFGLAQSPFEALVHRGLPCALYDCVAGVVLYFLMSRLQGGGPTVKRSPSAALGAPTTQVHAVSPGKRKKASITKMRHR
ncbi:MAG: rod shape-determining protein MreD [Coriobacteriaceae bacterium]|jgi:rod shape-determining protein MreD|nr:rod shape-determining protein MreD [Coriobacteriaceae bacterium]